MRILAAAFVLAAVVAAVPSAQGATDPCTPWQQKTLKSGLGSLVVFPLLWFGVSWLLWSSSKRRRSRH